MHNYRWCKINDRRKKGAAAVLIKNSIYNAIKIIHCLLHRQEFIGKPSSLITSLKLFHHREFRKILEENGEDCNEIFLLIPNKMALCRNDSKKIFQLKTRVAFFKENEKVFKI